MNNIAIEEKEVRVPTGTTTYKTLLIDICGTAPITRPKREKNSISPKKGMINAKDILYFQDSRTRQKLFSVARMLRNGYPIS